MISFGMNFFQYLSDWYVPYWYSIHRGEVPAKYDGSEGAVKLCRDFRGVNASRGLMSKWGSTIPPMAADQLTTYRSLPQGFLASV